MLKMVPLKLDGKVIGRVEVEYPFIKATIIDPDVKKYIQDSDITDFSVCYESKDEGE